MVYSAHAHVCSGLWACCFAIMRSGGETVLVASKPRGMSSVGATRILLLAGLLAGCAAKDYVLTWTVDGVKNYTE